MLTFLITSSSENIAYNSQLLLDGRILLQVLQVPKRIAHEMLSAVTPPFAKQEVASF